MKIAFIVHDFNRTWGHSRYVAELAERFSKEHDVHVFANTFEPDENLEKVHFHEVWAWRRNAFSTILTFILPSTFALGGHFDIIHSQGLCGLKFNVITAHQCNQEWYGARRRAAGMLSFREHVFGKVTTFLERRLYANLRATPVIAVSHRIKEDLRRHYNCQAPIEVIHHGVDVHRFSAAACSERRQRTRQSWGINDDRLVFLYVGDLRKGARQCILAMKQLETCQLVLVSRSDPAEWKQFIREERLTARVTLAGSSERVEEAYEAADAFLMPTPYDPFGLVVTEAMSSSLPIVVSRQAGASELVQGESNGLILEDVTNLDELVSHMMRLTADSELRRQLGECARSSVEGRTWDSIAEETMRVYGRVLALSSNGLASQVSATV